jgi:hypothetical protein
MIASAEVADSVGGVTATFAARAGVEVTPDGEIAKIKVRVTKNTQTPPQQ